MLIDSERLKQAILTTMPERSEVLLIVDNQPEGIVRCKDCKHCFTDGDNVRFNVCELNHNKVQSDDWFCADGEMKESRSRKADDTIPCFDDSIGRMPEL